MADLPPLYLKPGEERRLRQGHLWVFSNEVDTRRSPLGDYTPGQPVRILDARDRPLGSGYVNPHSLICARLVSRDHRRGLDRTLLVHRLNIALALRERFYPDPHYRLIHGEGDGLPGLVVERFGDTCVVQINTAGMEQAREAIVEALHRTLQPRHILLRCDSPIREMEGLSRYTEWAGEPGPEYLTIVENGLTFHAPAATGQKTGWYFDHRENRSRLAPYVRGRTVLDVFSYCGAWGITAAAGGAGRVLAVDSSRAALEAALENADHNGIGDRFEAREGDALETLKALREDQQRFDVVILDPPAFIKRRRDHRAGLKGYQRINQAAMQVLSREGTLITASCSAHLGEDEFRSAVNAGARHLDRSLRVVEEGHQAPDHPTHPAIPETRYLKALFGRVLPARDLP